MEGKERVLNGESCKTVARELQLPRSTLRDFLKGGESKPEQRGPGRGRGNRSKVLSEAEEKLVDTMVEKRRGLGYGMNFTQLQKALQVLLQRLCQKDLARVTGFEGSNQLPPMAYVYRLVARRSVLSLRAGMELSNSRAAVSRESVAQWFQRVSETVLRQPGVAEAWLDPSRICNMVSQIVL
jgi:transposase